LLSFWFVDDVISLFIPELMAKSTIIPDRDPVPGRIPDVSAQTIISSPCT
jgi:hypothetical protein